MTFLNPLLLFGLVAAAIPLIIHLFNFRRPRRIDFSSLTFIKELQKSTMQRVRIKQWLLLLLRTLTIAALVIAFARPTVQQGLVGLGAQVRTSVAMVIDNSRSMGLRDAQGEYLEQAQLLAAQIIEQLQPGDEVFVFTTSGEDSDAYTVRSLAADAVQDIEVAPAATMLQTTLRTALGKLEEASHLNREIYLISDFQGRTLTDSLGPLNTADVRTYMLPIGTREQANVSVEGVEVVSRIIEVGQPVRIQARLMNHGDETLEAYVASVYLAGERVAQATVRLEPGIPENVQFTVTPQQRGWLPGIVEIEDDAFSSDNSRHFTLNVPELRRILLVEGEGQPANYLSLAFSEAVTRGRGAIELTTIQENQLPATRLGDFNAIILAGTRSLSSGEVTTLERYVDGGGGVLFFPNAGAIAADYNAFLGAIGGGTFSGFSGELGQVASVGAFERIELEHPLFEGIFKRPEPGKDVVVERPMLSYAMNYSPGIGSEQTLIQLSNRFPFLQEIRHGGGVVLLMATFPELAWGDLPQRGLFVPLLYRSVYYLASNESTAGEQLIVGRRGELRLSGVDESATLKLVGPAGDEFTPEQRSVFGARLLQYDGTVLDPGIYEVMSGTNVVRRIAMNLDEAESDLSTLDPDDVVERLEAIANLTPQVLPTGLGEADRVVQTLQEARTGAELWNVFLMLALAFMVTEMLVARQWRPEAVSA